MSKQESKYLIKGFRKEWLRISRIEDSTSHENTRDIQFNDKGIEAPKRKIFPYLRNNGIKDVTIELKRMNEMEDDSQDYHVMKECQQG